MEQKQFCISSIQFCLVLLVSFSFTFGAWVPKELGDYIYFYRLLVNEAGEFKPRLQHVCIRARPVSVPLNGWMDFWMDGDG